MEIVIVIFIGAWLSGTCALAYRQLKKESREMNSDSPDGGDGK